MFNDLTSSVKIKKAKMFDVITKLNTLVEHYAKKRGLTNCIYDMEFVVYIENSLMVIQQGLRLKRIDMEKDFYTTDNYKIYKNTPSYFKKKSPLHFIIDDFIIAYYPEYKKIETFITKLLYNFPTELSKSDFEEINILYKKIQMNKHMPSAQEQIQRNNVL